MSLRSLNKYARSQTAKINENKKYFTAADSSWIQLRDSLWGKGLRSLTVSPRDLQKLRSSLDEDPLPNVTPTTYPVVKIPETMPDLWDLRGQQHLLVRSEYEEAEKAALSANEEGSDMFLITGQPGVGKSVLLIWFFMCRLALRLPTVLQVEEDEVLLFYEGGALQLLHPDKPNSYQGLSFLHSSPSKIWALVDSNPRLPNPSPLFSSCGPFFVLYARSPPEPDFVWRIKWVCFCVRLWALPEIIQARPFLGVASGGPYTSRQLRHLYDTYCASPKDLSLYSHKPKTYQDLVDSRARATPPDILRSIFQGSGPCITFHLVTLVEPSPGSRSICRKRVASRRAFEILWGRTKFRVSDMRFHYELLLRNPDMTYTLGWVFELRMHDLLRDGNPIRLFHIHGHRSEVDPVHENHKVIQLPSSFQVPLDEGDRLFVGNYYNLRAANFSTIDSLFFVHPPDEPSPILLAFQIRHDAVCDVDKEDLRRVNRLNFPRNVRKFFVAVTPDSIHPGAESLKTFFEGAGKRGRAVRQTPGKDWQVFRCPVSNSMEGLFREDESG